MSKKNVYGYCPICGAPGVMRQRRPDGDDTCEKHHKYPSKSAAKVPVFTVDRTLDECLSCDHPSHHNCLECSAEKRRKIEAGHCPDCGGHCDCTFDEFDNCICNCTCDCERGCPGELEDASKSWGGCGTGDVDDEMDDYCPVCGSPDCPEGECDALNEDEEEQEFYNRCGDPKCLDPNCRVYHKDEDRYLDGADKNSCGEPNCPVGCCNTEAEDEEENDLDLIWDDIYDWKRAGATDKGILARMVDEKGICENHAKAILRKHYQIAKECEEAECPYCKGEAEIKEQTAIFDVEGAMKRDRIIDRMITEINAAEGNSPNTHYDSNLRKILLKGLEELRG